MKTTRNCNSAPDTVPAEASPRHVLTIAEAKRRYREDREEWEGYRELVKLLIDSRFDRAFANDSYLDALILTGAMFERTQNSINLLTGKGEFLSELASSFNEALQRVKNSGGKARVIVLDEKVPSTALPIHEKNPGLEIRCGIPTQPLKHFIVCDGKMVRVEDLHGELTEDSLASDIRAQVYFNNPAQGKMLNTFFDNLWNGMER